MNKPKKKSNGHATKAAPKKTAAGKTRTGKDKLITITIDGREIKCKAGRNLVDVANENDIFIPSLCYYPEIEPPLGTCSISCTKVRRSMSRRPVTFRPRSTAGTGPPST